MRTFVLHRHPRLPLRPFNHAKLRLVPAHFFHNAIIVWTLFVGFLILIFGPVLIVALVWKLLRNLFRAK